MFPSDELFRITGVASAIRALRLVVGQGEGAHGTPFDPEGRVAHFFRFKEIVKGRRLARDASVKAGFSFSGARLVFDPTAVLDLVMDPQSTSYAPGSQSQLLADVFDRTYATLLHVLHDAFNGTPANLRQAIALMFELKVIGRRLVETVDEKTGKHATPRFLSGAVV